MYDMSFAVRLSIHYCILFGTPLWAKSPGNSTNVALLSIFRSNKDISFHLLYSVSILRFG